MVASTPTLLDERTFAAVKRHCHAGLEGPELLRRVAEAVRRSVPFDAYCASTVDPASNLITHGVAEGFGDEEDLDDEQGRIFLERIYFEEDLVQIGSMLRARRPVAVLSEATAGRLERSLRYRELLRPFGFGHELSGVFVDRSLWGSIDLLREAGRADFSQREVALVRRLAPHVGAGLRAAALRSRATGEDSDDAPGVLTLDHAGRVVSSTPAAERHLAELGELDPAWRTGRGLPIAVWMVAGALAQTLSPDADRDRYLIPRLRIRGHSGRWLTLYGSLTEPTAGRPSERVIVIGPARAEDVAWLNAAAYGLSPREEDVVKLVVRGLSTKQIAGALFIAEHTVQRHLSNAFEKVGVRSRPALLKRLFFEHLLPSLSGG